jgi:translation elongation factor EF-Tu-like GTPase
VTNQFTVEDTFLIEGRGLVVAGKLEGLRHGFRAGARVSIARPDGTRLVSGVRGARVSRPCFAGGVNIDVLLEEAFAREEVPRGSVVALEAE